ncbi:MAG: PKD domain-containing protein [Candidatus Thiodiazotropha sp.]
MKHNKSQKSFPFPTSLLLTNQPDKTTTRIFANLKQQFIQPKHRALCFTLIAIGALSFSIPAKAHEEDLVSWQSTYPSSTTDNKLYDKCQVCHAFSTEELNSYGYDYMLADHNLSAIESLDSDNDPSGATNLEEIISNSQPGWTEGPYNAINSTSPVAVSPSVTTALPPDLINGTYDPAVTNQPPVADIGGPYNGTENIPLTFDASGSSDADGTITQYLWDLGDGNSRNGAVVTHTYTDSGAYDVTLTVTDDDGDSTTATTSAIIGSGNQPPVANANGPYTGDVGETIQFSGNGSADADGSIVSYDWTFGDGTSGVGLSPTHTYTSPGTYNVTLTVTDNNNAVDSDDTSVSIEPGNQPPTANPSGPYAANVGEELLFDGTASSDADGDIISYEWDFGDGTTATGATPSHTYLAAGSYNVTLTVTDDGNLSGSGVTTATIGAVNKMAPKAVANGPYSGTVNIEMTFNSDGSNDPDGSIVSYSWDFGDGNTATEANASHTYTDEGTFIVTLTVIDNDGLMDTDTTNAVIGVGNLSPVADAMGPYCAKACTEVQFDSSGSFDPDGAIVAYEWNFGDGSGDTQQNPTHSYAKKGVYNVSLTVYDDSGAMDSNATIAIIRGECQPVPPPEPTPTPGCKPKPDCKSKKGCKHKPKPDCKSKKGCNHQPKPDCKAKKECNHQPKPDCKAKKECNHQHKPDCKAKKECEQTDNSEYDTKPHCKPTSEDRENSESWGHDFLFKKTHDIHNTKKGSLHW